MIPFFKVTGLPITRVEYLCDACMVPSFAFSSQSAIALSHVTRSKIWRLWPRRLLHVNSTTVPVLNDVYPINFISNIGIRLWYSLQLISKTFSVDILAGDRSEHQSKVCFEKVDEIFDVTLTTGFHTRGFDFTR